MRLNCVLIILTQLHTYLHTMSGSAIFAHARKIYAAAERQALDECMMDLEDDFTNHFQVVLDRELNREYNRFDQILAVSQQLHNRFMATVTPRWFIITIRPLQCTLDEFTQKIHCLLERKCFLDWTYSLEQKGTTIAELGHGMHVHIVASMRQRSRGEVIRDLLSSFNDWVKEKKIAPNCIDIGTTKNHDALVQNYLVDYSSPDNHKEITRTWDALWREQNGLCSLYKKT